MKKIYHLLTILVLLFSLTILSAAQEKKDTVDYKPTALELHDLARTGFIPDTLARYPGGVDGILLHIQKNIRYPRDAAMSKKTGRIIVSFSVDTAGNTGDFVIEKSAGKLLDREAIRVIETMKDWKPAIKNGSPVKSYYKQIVSFNWLGLIHR